MESQKENSQKLKGVYRFFCWCSGARLYLLEQCPVDFNKYFGIGITIFLTGWLAALSGGYAVYYVFKNSWASIAFGLFWGSLIFFIDWYLVSSLRKENKLHKEIIASIPRFFLAFLLAVVIAHPLKIKLFEREIAQELAVLQTDKKVNFQQHVFKEFDELGRLQEENAQLESEITKKENYRKELYDQIIKEAEGRSVTGKMGKGPVYKEKKLEFDQFDQEYKELKSRYLNKIATNEARIADLKTKRDASVDNGTQLTNSYDGLLARMEAMGSMTRRNVHLKMASWFILLLFICIEILPIFVKLISRRGPYDQLFELMESKQSLEFKKELYEHKDHLQGDLYYKMEKSRISRENDLKNNETLIDQLFENKLAIQKEYIKNWVAKEREKIEKESEEILNKNKLPMEPATDELKPEEETISKS